MDKKEFVEQYVLNRTKAGTGLDPHDYRDYGTVGRILVQEALGAWSMIEEFELKQDEN